MGEHLRTSYSGDPAHLPAAVAGLLPRLRDLLRRHGGEPRPEVLEAFIQTSAAQHGIAMRQQLHQALRGMR